MLLSRINVSNSLDIVGSNANFIMIFLQFRSDIFHALGKSLRIDALIRVVYLTRNFLNIFLKITGAEVSSYSSTTSFTGIGRITSYQSFVLCSGRLSFRGFGSKQVSGWLFKSFRFIFLFREQFWSGVRFRVEVLSHADP